MNCRFCGVEVEEDVKTCPACGKKLKSTLSRSLGFIFVVITVLISIIIGYVLLILIFWGLLFGVASYSEHDHKYVVNSEFGEWLRSNNFILNEAIKQEKNDVGYYYTDADIIWDKSIKSRIKPVEDSGKFIFISTKGDSIKYRKINDKCIPAPTNPKEHVQRTACAHLYLEGLSSTRMFNTHYFGLLLYADSVKPSYGSLEHFIINYKK